MADQNNLVTIQSQSPSTSQLNITLPSVITTDIIQDNCIINNKDDNLLDEPDIKRKKIEQTTTTTKKCKEQFDKLEFRLKNGILSCAVCLDLPPTAMFQCQMGHLMCAACFTHLLADGRLRDQVATCPNCRVEISKTTATRNLAVEKAVSELPSECQYCGEQFPTRTLVCHQELYCEERPTNCHYTRIGCQWRGPIHEAKMHEANCIHPKKTGAEVMAALENKDKDNVEDKKMFSVLIDLLSYEKILFNGTQITERSRRIKEFIKEMKINNNKRKCLITDLQLKPYRTDEYVHKLYYETSKFSAFNHQWVVKARINNSQKDPHQSNERQITYQLILKTKTSCRLYIQYFVLKGPFSDIKVNTQIYKKCFTDEENESEYFLLPLTDTSECNRLLAAKTINFRLIMFQVSP